MDRKTPAACFGENGYFRYAETPKQDGITTEIKSI